MEVLGGMRFEIIVDGGTKDLITTVEELQYPKNVDELSAALLFDNLNESEIHADFLTTTADDIIGVEPTSKNKLCPDIINTGKRGNYLIVAAHRYMEEALCPYIHYKQGQNYHVDVEYADKGGNYWRYVTPMYDYVLLVGSVEELPPYCESDDFYGRRVGRWIIETNKYNWEEELVKIVEKSISAERYYTNSSPYAVLFSGTDSKRRVSKRFYKNTRKIANKSFEKMGIWNTVVDGRNSNGGEMSSILSESPHFFVYRGHGGNWNSGDWYDKYNNCWRLGYSYIGAPYGVSPEDLQEWHADNPYSLGFGFACHLKFF